MNSGYDNPGIRQAIREYLNENLSIETSHKEGRLLITILLEGMVVSSDFIDYTDVVRVVREQNRETMH